jgi:hypothetical protein
MGSGFFKEQASQMKEVSIVINEKNFLVNHISSLYK